jgi:hypothetical protein
MWFAAAFATASLFVIRRLPAEWKSRLASVTPKLVSMERWRELKDARVRALIAVYVLAWRKRRAMKLLEQDLTVFTAQRDAHWMQQLAQRAAAIPPERLMALIALAHPDKHNGSRLAFSGPIRSRPMRCCSTPITTLSASWAVCRGGAFTTICERPSTRSAAARSARSTPAFRRWSAIS